MTEQDSVGKSAPRPETEPPKPKKAKKAKPLAAAKPAPRKSAKTSEPPSGEAKPARAKAAKKPAKAKAPATSPALPPPIAPSAPILVDAPKAKPQAAAASATAAPPALPDVEALATNVAHFVEKGGKALAAFLAPREAHPTVPTLSEEVTEAVKSIGNVAQYWLTDPTRTAQAQSALSHDFVNLWAHTLRRLTGQEEKPVAPPPPGDKRFSGKDWEANPFYDFLRQAYVMTSNWALELVDKADQVDAHTRDKAAFYVRQLSSALAPSNFLVTNPELLRETFEQSGANLVRGADILAEDIEAGGGSLKIRQVDHSKFELGVNLAVTPGKVVFRNDLIELIQYAPTTDEVHKRPLLIVPPWINKFYILDLNPEKSFIRWAVAQGLTVFVISWINPDSRHRDKDFAAYMKEGVFAALDAIEGRTGEDNVTAIGYCVGGTLLSSTLAYMAEKGDTRIESATLFTTQVDFRYPGDLRVFVDEAQIAATEEKMKDAGYLDGAKMANAFNMLRPNDLIWSYVVNNYISRQGADGFRPAGVELRLHPHDGGEPLVLSAQLLPQQQSHQGRDGARRRQARPRQGDGPNLQSGLARGSHRAGEIGVHRRAIFRRTDALCDGGLGPYRRRRQSRRQAEISILDGSAAERQIRGLGGEGQRDARLMVAGLDSMDRRTGARKSPGATARRRQAEAHLRRAGRICADEGVKRLHRSRKP
jgi:polyhydroxyalkanoate synthase